MAAELQIEGQKILVEEYDSEYDPNTEGEFEERVKGNSKR